MTSNLALFSRLFPTDGTASTALTGLSPVGLDKAETRVAERVARLWGRWLSFVTDTT